MEVAEHIDFLQLEGDLLAAAATGVDPDTPVTTVPDWPLRDLLRHIGGIHRWAATTIREARTERFNTTLLEVVGAWPDDDDLVEWFREGHGALVETLRTADPELDCWHFFDAPTPIAFWARRQTHETAIHRADAQSCTGAISPYAPELAADGIDEILFGFAARTSRYPETQPPPRLDLRAKDIDREWLARLGPEHVEVVAEPGPDVRSPADCSVDASVSDLYLLLWNRLSPDTVTVSGDPECLAVWRDAVRVRWSE
ncbi:MAG: maleylpyruvate isomerase family mycothiol-dependent enzyme [Acidimicrobiia bacterium]